MQFEVEIFKFGRCKALINGFKDIGYRLTVFTGKRKILHQADCLNRDELIAHLQLYKTGGIDSEYTDLREIPSKVNKHRKQNIANLKPTKVTHMPRKPQKTEPTNAVETNALTALASITLDDLVALIVKAIADAVPQEVEEETGEVVEEAPKKRGRRKAKPEPEPEPEEEDEDEYEEEDEDNDDDVTVKEVADILKEYKSEFEEDDFKELLSEFDLTTATQKALKGLDQDELNKLYGYAKEDLDSED